MSSTKHHLTKSTQISRVQSTWSLFKRLLGWKGICSIQFLCLSYQFKIGFTSPKLYYNYVNTLTTFERCYDLCKNQFMPHLAQYLGALNETNNFSGLLNQLLILWHYLEFNLLSQTIWFRLSKIINFNIIREKYAAQLFYQLLVASKRAYFLSKSLFLDFSDSKYNKHIDHNSKSCKVKMPYEAFIKLLPIQILQQSLMQILEQNQSKENLPISCNLQPQIEESDQGEDMVSFKETISNDTFSDSKNKLIKFVHSLGAFRKSDLRPDVLAHCACLNKTRKVIPNYISDETILRMASVRIEKMLKNKRIKKNWSEQDIKILVWVLSKYADFHFLDNLDKDIQFEDWQKISQMIPGVTIHGCMFKWLSIKKVNLSSKNWENSESNLLKELVESQFLANKHSTSTINWKSIAERLYRKNEEVDKVFRNAKQCREHWCCFLNPELKKGPWKIEEDILLLTKIRSNNGRRWSQIVSYFEGRTENALKNRFTLLIQKQKKTSKSKQQKNLIEDCLEYLLQSQASKTKQRRAIFLTEILSQQKKLEKDPNTYTSIEGNSFYEMPECNKIDSEENVESIQIPKSVQMTIRFEFNFDQLKQLAISKEMKPGCVKNGNFEPQI